MKSLAILSTRLYLVPLLLLLLVAGCRGQPPTPTPPAAPPAGAAEVNITLSAQNIAFDTAAITVPAGALVIVHFVNNDSSVIFHDFSLFETGSATTPLFIGDVVQGGKDINYQFVAPATPGTYFFHCGVHPLIMTGDFIVIPAP